MAMAYADAVATLYRSSQEQFVSERKRLAAELKAAGDKAGAAQLGKLARPSLSAWAVNQLWWQARDSFDELLVAGERLRQGELAASPAHREALTALRTRASSLLAEAGHAVNDATLRRVTTTLSALAATGSFEPDLPGALSADRDPPGFDALGSAFGAARPSSSLTSSAASAASAPVPAAAHDGARADNDNADTPAAARRAAEQAAAEQAEALRQAEVRQRQKEEAARREEAERQAARERREAERRQVVVTLEAARKELAQRRALVERLDAELGVARQALEKSRDAILELEQQLARLGPGQS